MLGQSCESTREVNKTGVLSADSQHRRGRVLWRLCPPGRMGDARHHHHLIVALERFPHAPTGRDFPLRRRCDSDFRRRWARSSRLPFALRRSRLLSRAPALCAARREIARSVAWRLVIPLGLAHLYLRPYLKLCPAKLRPFRLRKGRNGRVTEANSQLRPPLGLKQR